ncbi:MAG: hypothetical protein GWP91_21120 [Rhodobacterales bacterium]|nr:hypothetical protein [Rhodobacterales bacterium]
MTTLLVRPYPVEALGLARTALHPARSNDLSELQALYARACAELLALDPDEVHEWRSEHPNVAQQDRSAGRAAIELADAWEGIVAVGATIKDPKRFRGFVWLAAHVRYELAKRPSAKLLGHYAQGAALPKTSAEDSLLFAVLPALVGLGPNHPDELAGPCPLPSKPVWSALGLEDADWAGLDPLDGQVVSAEVCRSQVAGLQGPWRAMAERGVGSGLLFRKP